MTWTFAWEMFWQSQFPENGGTLSQRRFRAAEESSQEGRVWPGPRGPPAGPSPVHRRGSAVPESSVAASTARKQGASHRAPGPGTLGSSPARVSGMRPWSRICLPPPLSRPTPSGATWVSLEPARLRLIILLPAGFGNAGSTRSRRDSSPWSSEVKPFGVVWSSVCSYLLRQVLRSSLQIDTAGPRVRWGLARLMRRAVRV